jgi:hypothetical protein
MPKPISTRQVIALATTVGVLSAGTGVVAGRETTAKETHTVDSRENATSSIRLAIESLRGINKTSALAAIAAGDVRKPFDNYDIYTFEHDGVFVAAGGRTTGVQVLPKDIMGQFRAAFGKKAVPFLLVPGVSGDVYDVTYFTDGKAIYEGVRGPQGFSIPIDVSAIVANTPSWRIQPNVRLALSVADGTQYLGRS